MYRGRESISRYISYLRCSWGSHHDKNRGVTSNRLFATAAAVPTSTGRYLTMGYIGTPSQAPRHLLCGQTVLLPSRGVWGAKLLIRCTQRR